MGAQGWGDGLKLGSVGPEDEDEQAASKPIAIELEYLEAMGEDVVDADGGVQVSLLNEGDVYFVGDEIGQELCEFGAETISIPVECVDGIHWRC